MNLGARFSQAQLNMHQMKPSRVPRIADVKMQATQERKKPGLNHYSLTMQQAD